MKFCVHCGQSLEDSALFCPNCGQAQESIPVDPDAVFESDPAAEEKKNSLATKILVRGILALAFMESFFLSFIGIIFAAKGLGFVKEYLALYGEHQARTRVGQIFCKIALPLSIVLTVFAFLYVVIYGALIGMLLGGEL